MRNVDEVECLPGSLPQVPARAVAAAVVARALAGVPPHQRFSLPSNSEDLVSVYGIKPHGQTIEELEEDFYREVFISTTLLCFFLGTWLSFCSLVSCFSLVRVLGDYLFFSWRLIIYLPTHVTIARMREQVLHYWCQYLYQQIRVTAS